MQPEQLLDCAGRRRSPATLASFHQGHSPRNKGLRYPPDPPTVEEIIAVMRAAGKDPDGIRLRGLIVVLWRAGLRISEALALSETDLDAARGAILVRQGKGGKRREVGMDRWAWGSSSHGSRSARPFRSAHCSASCEDRPAADGAPPRAFAHSCAGRPRGPDYGAGSRHTSSGTRMQSRCPAKAYRSS
jgi:integrase